MTDDSALVSIITPSYNQAAYLEQTILSVLQQDYPAIEYLVVDGCSTDGSLGIIKKHSHKLAWWLSEPDRGQADAINKGFQHARGKYVAWLNSDDLYLPSAVARAVAALEANPDAALVYSDLRSIDAEGHHFHTIRYRQYSLADLLAFRIIGQPSVFMRREFLMQTGLLELEYQYLLDHHLWIRMAALAAIRYMPQEWAAARYHPTAKNVAQAAAFGQEAFRILEWAQTQPALAAIIAKNPRRVSAGAHRLDARYLLDAGSTSKSLKAYWQTFKAQPLYALAHWHRILYALFGFFGFSGIKKKYTRI